MRSNVSQVAMFSVHRHAKGHDGDEEGQEASSTSAGDERHEGHEVKCLQSTWCEK